MSSQYLIPLALLMELGDTGSKTDFEKYYALPLTSTFTQSLLDITLSAISFESEWLQLLRTNIDATLVQRLLMDLSDIDQESGWLASAINSLQNLKSLEAGWNGYEAEAPNEIAFNHCDIALSVLHEIGFKPNRITPSADGGVALCFISVNKYADIECYNSGDIAAIIKDHDSTFRNTWDIDPGRDNIREALQNIREFIES